MTAQRIQQKKKHISRVRMSSGKFLRDYELPMLLCFRLMPTNNLGYCLCFTTQNDVSALKLILKATNRYSRIGRCCRKLLGLNLISSIPERRIEKLPAHFATCSRWDENWSSDRHSSVL